MASKLGSRWAGTAEDEALKASRKQQKAEKKRLKAEKSRRGQEQVETDKPWRDKDEGEEEEGGGERQPDRPSKRRKLTPARTENEATAAVSTTAGASSERSLLRFEAPRFAPCRGLDNFEKLNDIEEGTYGFVCRAKEKATGRIVALKKLKVEPGDRSGFPVTALREIKALRNCDHGNIVRLEEIVVGEGASKLPAVHLVLEFLEHDLRTILLQKPAPFAASEVKLLLVQLARGVSYLHRNYLLHRDLKTSNLLLSNRGRLKIADFGMARYVGDPAPELTTLVVTLWYRAPELLLGTKTYGAEIDMWSVGCVFGELLDAKAMFEGSNEVSQLSKIFEGLGTPTEESWPQFRRLPHSRSLKLPRKTSPQVDKIRPRYADRLTAAGCSLLRDLLSPDPSKRPTAEEMLRYPYFEEMPRPKPEHLFPTFPSKAKQERRLKPEPNAPVRGQTSAVGEQDWSNLFADRDGEAKGGGFKLRVG